MIKMIKLRNIHKYFLTISKNIIIRHLLIKNVKFTPSNNN